MAQDNLQIIDILEQNTLNMIFYENSFTKTTFFVKILPKWNIPTFYLDFDLLYSGFVKSGQTPLSKNTILVCPNADNLHENLRSIIDKIYFGAYDEKKGSLESIMKIYNTKNYFVPEVYGGINETECSRILKKFFQEKRQ